jgi:hypothetical protein
MNVNLETMEASLEKTEAAQESVETEMGACLEEMKLETIGSPEDRIGNQRPTVV